jgi:hypothetical protein
VLEHFKPILVMLDTQARVTVGAEENSNTDMGRFVEVLEGLRRSCGACILIVHHTPRNGDGLRGAVALEGAATSIIHFAKEGDVVKLETKKQKDTKAADPLYLDLNEVGDSAVLFDQVPGNHRKNIGVNDRKLLVAVAEWGDEEVLATVIVDVLAPLHKGTVYRSAKKLANMGKLIKRQDGRSNWYRIPSQDLYLYEAELNA